MCRRLTWELVKNADSLAPPPRDWSNRFCQGICLSSRALREGFGFCSCYRSVSGIRGSAAQMPISACGLKEEPQSGQARKLDFQQGILVILDHTLSNAALWSSKRPVCRSKHFSSWQMNNFTAHLRPPERTAFILLISSGVHRFSLII